MTPPDSEAWAEYLDPASDSLQRLHKKLRRWANAGFATPEDLEAAASALFLVREIAARYGVRLIDRDGRTERNRPDRTEPAG